MQLSACHLERWSTRVRIIPLLASGAAEAAEAAHAHAAASARGVVGAEGQAMQ